MGIENSTEAHSETVVCKSHILVNTKVAAEMGGTHSEGSLSDTEASHLDTWMIAKSQV